MKIYYTFWHVDHGRYFNKYLDAIERVNYDGAVITIPFGIPNYRINQPMISWYDISRLAIEIGKRNMPYILKIQFHPTEKLDYLDGLNPVWWPGWLAPQESKRPLVEIIAGMIEWAIATIGCRPDIVIPGVEFDQVAKLLLYERITLEYDDTAFAYGTNFWQPIRWKYRWLIWFLHLLRKDDETLDTILKESDLYEIRKDRLSYASETIYRSLLTKRFWSKFDYVGLSCYWYPSMTSKNIGEIEEAYFDYESQGVRLNYFETVREWANKMGRPLMVTESGVLYNAPIGNDREAVKDWYRVTMRLFSSLTDTFCIWEDCQFGAALEENLFQG